VRKTLELVAVDQPIVVVFDDIQWGESTFLDLVEHVADVSRGAPILLLCMARPELLDVRPAWGGGKHNATSVLLEPLPAEETGALASTLLADADATLSARIATAAAGNPLFVEEMVELARESGGEVAVPPTIHALLAARLDSLPREERVVLECGSVEGEVFHRGAVTALEPGDGQIDARLVGLVRKELVRPETPTLAAEDAYRFRHLLIRDAAYEGFRRRRGSSCTGASPSGLRNAARISWSSTRLLATTWSRHAGTATSSDCPRTPRSRSAPMLAWPRPAVGRCSARTIRLRRTSWNGRRQSPPTSSTSLSRSTSSARCSLRAASTTRSSVPRAGPNGPQQAAIRTPSSASRSKKS
jgi:hypothetical protein